MNKQTDLAEVRAAMVRNFERLATEPFIGHFLLKLDVAESKGIPTAAVDTRRLRWNPEFFAPMANGHRIGVIAHEMVHVALGHPEWLGRTVRRLKDEGKGEAEIARHLHAGRIAADYIVNAIVIENMKLDLPEGRLYEPGYDRHDLDTLYRHLIERGTTKEEDEGEKIGGEVFPGRPRKRKPETEKKDGAEEQDGDGDGAEGEGEAEDGTEPGEDGEGEGDGADGEGAEGDEGEGDEGSGDGDGDGDGDETDGEGKGKGKGGEEGEEDGAEGEGDGGGYDVDEDEDFDGEGDGDGYDEDEDGDFSEDGYETEEDEAEAAREYTETVVQADKYAAKIGKESGWMKAAYDAVAIPEVDWRSVLAQFMTCNAETRRSFARPNRLAEGSGTILPSRGGRQIGTIVIALDSSGSMFSAETLATLAGETESILASVEAKEVWLVGCDDEVRSAVRYEGGPLLDVIKKDVLLGGGGTNFRPVWKWIADNNVVPDCLVYMTDLAGGFPTPAEAAAANVRTLWLGVETDKYWEERFEKETATNYPDWSYVRQSLSGF